MRQPSLRLTLTLAIGSLALLAALLVLRDMYVGWQRLERVEALREATLLGDGLFDATEKISVERDIGYSILHASGKDIVGDLSRRLLQSRRDTDQLFRDSMGSLSAYGMADLNMKLKKAEEQFASLQDLRGKIDAAMALPIAQRDRALSQRWFKDSTALIMNLQELWMDFARHYTDIDVFMTLRMRFKHILGIIMDYSGRQRSLIGRLFAENVDPTPEEQADLLRWAGVAENGWVIGGTLADQGGLAPGITPYFNDALSHYFTIHDMVQGIFYVPGAATRPYPISVEFWLDLATQANDSLSALKDAAMTQSRDYAEKLEMQARLFLLYHAVLLFVALSLCLYALRTVRRRVLHPLRDLADALADAAEGKPVTFISADGNRNDEIGALARALRALQRKT
ncbi:MAG: HAMP domain-containing protein [Alphaproteobacteria bacterium]|nr:HAMP domain-containing protein [Alphaproteobacteria bacterium]